jgi:hypothetical protein
MIRKILTGLVLAASVFVANAAFADDPSLQQVYDAAHSGRLSEAHSMMNKVLQDHPNSAKAHFVDAEILAREGLISSAKTELATAERLAPGLPFAKPQAVESLRSLLAATGATAQRPPVAAVQPAASSNIPWGMILLAALVAAVIYFVMAMRKRNAPYIPAAPAAAAGYGTGFGSSGAATMPAYGPNGPLPPFGAGPAAGMGGMGSGIMGSLATGAAVGAGIVAGEALMHHFTDGHRSEPTMPLAADSNWNSVEPPASYDMGGSDFGVSDTSSWDDSSSGGGGGDDWN